MRPVLAAAALLALAAPALAQEAPEPPTPASVVAAAPASDWKPIDPADLLVMTLAPDRDGNPREVVIQLVPPPFSQPWVENIRTLARAHWWDGTSVYRVVDNWVAQWGDVDEAKALPEGVRTTSADAFVTRVERDPEEIRDYVLTPDRAEIVVSRFIDSYAVTAFVAGWPVGLDDEGGATAWPAHCYAVVGVARSLEDMGSGSELYAVIGHAPRQLDRNIAVVGRVIEGIEHLSTLPRGKGEAGVYDDPALRVPIVSVRLMSELLEEESKKRGLYLGGSRWPSYQYLSTESDSFAQYAHVRANRHDDFYKVPAGGVDICNLPVPVRGLLGQ